jgi:hypothetical protein
LVRLTCETVEWRAVPGAYFVCVPGIGLGPVDYYITVILCIYVCMYVYIYIYMCVCVCVCVCACVVLYGMLVGT